MSWFLVVLAGLFEIVWAIGLKYTQGFTQIWPSLITLAAMLLSLLLLGLAVKQLPIGLAYSLWVAIGILGSLVFGVLLLGESFNLLKLVSALLILLGVIGLKLAH